MLLTWLPLPDFHQSARSLSEEHLTAQRHHVLELLELFHAVEESELPGGYRPHHVDEDSPIYKMWRGYEIQLAEYGLVVSDEWASRRGHSDAVYDKIRFHQEAAISEDADMSKPNWFGDVELHISHQVALVKSSPEFYNKVFKVGHNDMPLVWPESKYA